MSFSTDEILIRSPAYLCFVDLIAIYTEFAILTRESTKRKELKVLVSGFDVKEFYITLALKKIVNSQLNAHDKELC